MSSKKSTNLVLKEIHNRAAFLVDVGLNYLTLNRLAMSLSGGEAQRIRLATQIGSRLSGVLYVLDEPSIGLHQRDNAKLIKTMKEMRDLGNTLIVVEHDEETMRNADFIVDIGPGAGVHGGKVVATGSLEDMVAKSSPQVPLKISKTPKNQSPEIISLAENTSPFQKKEEKETARRSPSKAASAITLRTSMSTSLLEHSPS